MYIYSRRRQVKSTQNVDHNTTYTSPQRRHIYTTNKDEPERRAISRTVTSPSQRMIIPGEIVCFTHAATPVFLRKRGKRHIQTGSHTRNSNTKLRETGDEHVRRMRREMREEASHWLLVSAAADDGAYLHLYREWWSWSL